MNNIKQFREQLDITQNGVEHKIRVPQIKSLETAIRIYYERIELRNGDIREIFGSLGSKTICGLKQAAKDRMKENDIPSWDAKAVNTEAAFEAWGLDIDDLEKRLNKLKKLNLHS